MATVSTMPLTGFDCKGIPAQPAGTNRRRPSARLIYFAHHLATVQGIPFYNVASTRLPGQLAGDITKSEFSPFTAYSAAAQPATLPYRPQSR
jgi:hypothetical protein